MIDRLSQIDPHPALYLLRNCFSLPRLLYLLRSSPSYNLQDQLTDFDNVMKEGSERICNVVFDNTGWKQATLPISLGGIGLTAASDIAFSAYASSMHASQNLTTGILSHFPESSVDQSLCQMIQAWSGLGFLVVPEESRHLQKSWSDIYFKAKAEGLKDGLNQHRLACLSTASQPHSGDWLKAIPVASLGTALDGESVRVGIAVRLGLRICERHTCRCGVLIDEFGLHPLSCRLSAGRIPRHSALNDVIKRTLDSAGLHSILEPIGLDRGDGKRPDGVTVFPFSNGKPVAWDATCCDSFAASSIVSSATSPGSVARAAEDRKAAKYANLCDRFIFRPVAVETSRVIGPQSLLSQDRKAAKYANLCDRFIFRPVAVETSGVIGPQSLLFLRQLGLRLARKSGDLRESAWLFQRISISIVRGNGYCIQGASTQQRQD